MKIRTYRDEESYDEYGAYDDPDAVYRRSTSAPAFASLLLIPLFVLLGWGVYEGLQNYNNNTTPYPQGQQQSPLNQGNGVEYGVGGGPAANATVVPNTPTPTPTPTPQLIPGIGGGY